MHVSPTELAAFHEFALANLNNGGAETITDLALQWDAKRETEETAADIRASLEDIEAGRVEPLADAFADIRRCQQPTPR